MKTFHIISGLVVFTIVMCFGAAAYWLGGQELTHRCANLSGAFIFTTTFAIAAGVFTALKHKINP